MILRILSDSIAFRKSLLRRELHTRCRLRTVALSPHSSQAVLPALASSAIGRKTLLLLHPKLYRSKRRLTIEPFLTGPPPPPPTLDNHLRTLAYPCTVERPSSPSSTNGWRGMCVSTARDRRRRRAARRPADGGSVQRFVRPFGSDSFIPARPPVVAALALVMLRFLLASLSAIWATSDIPGNCNTASRAINCSTRFILRDSWPLRSPKQPYN
jgi:hypothetical protein